MKEITIKELAYLIKEAKRDGQPQPIFFLGAGASVSGNIPLATEIAKTILNDYKNSPFIQKLDTNEKTYAKLMECLMPYQRNELLKKYIEKAKINVTHIYLAQLIKNGFADYVLTVNFDNLILRALALYNEFPPIYDIAILKDFTTTTFKEKSIVYLHGQNHGLWLLNTKDEMEKVKNTVPRILDCIMNKRQWIFLGYSGNDLIFEHLKKIGRFDNGLYWVGYKDNKPEKHVQDFLNTPNVNACFISGYDSDSFMIKLNEELELEQPEILDKPFSCLEKMLNNIVDVNEEEHFKGVKERLEIAKRNVKNAIDKFEKHKSVTITSNELKLDALKKEIINLLISEKYNSKQISELEGKAKKLNNDKINSMLAELYSSWGIYLYSLTKTKENVEVEKLYNEIFAKYQKAIEIKSDFHEAYNDWGICLGSFAKTKTGPEAEKLYNEIFAKYQKAIEIKSDFHEAYSNWGNDLCEFAKTKTGPEAERLYKEAFAKYQKAIEIKPDKDGVYYNWGNDLCEFAKTKTGPEAERLYKEAFAKYQKAIEIKPDKDEVYNNWGIYLCEFAKTKTGPEAERLYKEAFAKYQKAIEIKPDKNEAYYNWGICLCEFAKTKTGPEAERLYKEAFAKYQKVIEIRSDDHETYYNWGNNLGLFAESKTGLEAERLYKEAFAKYQKVIEIRSDFHEAYYNWGIGLCGFAKTKDGLEAEKLYNEAIGKFQKAVDNGGKCYGLSCLFAVQKRKDSALKYLEISLLNHEIDTEFVLNDKDWTLYLENAKFKAVIRKYEK